MHRRGPALCRASLIRRFSTSPSVAAGPRPPLAAGSTPAPERRLSRLGGVRQRYGAHEEKRWASISPNRSFGTSQPIENHAKFEPKTLSSRWTYSQQVLTANPKHTSLEDLIARIEPISASQALRDHHFLLVLVTPSYAHHLRRGDSGETKTKRLVRGIFDRYAENTHKWCNETNVSFTVAVVDRLSPPPEDENSPSISEAMGASSGVDGQHGLRDAASKPALEGISVSLLPISSLAGEFNTSAHLHRSSITFRMHATNQEASDRFHEIEVPLSNTVFQTGKESTMISGMLKRAKKSSFLEFGAVAPHNRAYLTWPERVSGRAAPSLSAPLLPLTAPLRVEASGGNIIRQVMDPENNVVPASEDLERNVHQYFETTGTSLRQVSVWAVVYSPVVQSRLEERARSRAGKATTQQLTRGEISPYSLQELLWAGAQLRRVVSGGGGWGKKAGLLALDPGPMSETIFDPDNETPFKAIANRGDFIQHFLLLEDSDGTEARSDAPANRSGSFEYGAIRSLVDSDTGDDASDRSSIPQLTRNHFGVLSEKGFQWRFIKVLSSDGAHDELVLASSNIDVPDSRYTSIYPVAVRTYQSVREFRIPLARGERGLPDRASPRTPEVRSGASLADASRGTASSQYTPADSGSLEGKPWRTPRKEQPPKSMPPFEILPSEPNRLVALRRGLLQERKESGTRIRKHGSGPIVPTIRKLDTGPSIIESAGRYEARMKWVESMSKETGKASGDELSSTLPIRQVRFGLSDDPVAAMRRDSEGLKHAGRTDMAPTSQVRIRKPLVDRALVRPYLTRLKHSTGPKSAPQSRNRKPFADRALIRPYIARGNGPKDRLQSRIRTPLAPKAWGYLLRSKYYRTIKMRSPAQQLPRRRAVAQSWRLPRGQSFRYRMILSRFASNRRTASSSRGIKEATSRATKQRANMRRAAEGRYSIRFFLVDNEGPAILVNASENYRTDQGRLKLKDMVRRTLSSPAKVEGSNDQHTALLERSKQLATPNTNVIRSSKGALSEDMPDQEKDAVVNDLVDNILQYLRPDTSSSITMQSIREARIASEVGAPIDISAPEMQEKKQWSPRLREATEQLDVSRASNNMATFLNRRQPNKARLQRVGKAIADELDDLASERKKPTRKESGKTSEFQDWWQGVDK